jgi:hypothetical protein
LAYVPNRRLRAEDVEAVRSALEALADMTDYHPLNAAYAADKVKALGVAMEQAQRAEARAQRALDAARDAAQAAEWAAHYAILGVRQQIVAQYGPDADQVRAIGLKKASDRKRPVRRLRATASVE